MENDKALKSRSIISLFSLFFQSGYSAFLGLAANLVLTIVLSPSIFGIYITVLSLISLLNYFSDIGLAASLIQKKEISDEDIRTTFTVQQLLIITIITISFFATPFIVSFYKLPETGKYLYWALLLGFFISSLKTIPSVFLERKIQFHKIVTVQIVENTVFYASVILFALQGFQLMSFTYAVILRAVVGLVLIYRISPWTPKVSLSWASLKHLLHFGLPFQGSSFLALFKDDLITLFLSKIFGFEVLGYIGWAKKWAEAPIRIIMDNVTRVMFPLVSRFQEDKERVSRIIEKTLYYETAILAPVMMGMALFMRPITELIPHYSKWQIALPYYYIFVLSSFLVIYMSPFMNFLNALGKAKLTFSFMVLWTIITWLGTTFLIPFIHGFSFPVTHLAVSLTFIFVVYQMKRVIHFSFLKPIAPFIACALLMGAIVYLLEILFMPLSIFHLIAIAAVGAGVYYGALLLLFRVHLYREIRSFLHLK